MVERALDDFELDALGRPAAQFVEYTGVIDHPRMMRAFELLCDRYPVVRSRVRYDGRTHFLYVTPSFIPAYHRYEGDVAAVEHYLRAPWDPTQAMAELVAVDGDSRGYLALRADHAILDARSWTDIFRELWGLYYELTEGQDVVVPKVGALPAAPTTVLQHDLGLDPPGWYAKSVGRPALQAENELGQRATGALIRAARAAGTTVHALLCGAALVAQLTFGSSTRPEGSRMGCLSAVDLRQLATRRVANTATTKLTGWHWADVRVARGDSCADVGRRVKRQLAEAMGTKNLPLIDPPFPVETSTLDQKLAKTMVTNIGVQDPIPHPPGVVIEAWRRVIPLTTRTFPWHGVWTFQGTMRITSVYPSDRFRHDEATALTQHLITMLHGLGV